MSAPVDCRTPVPISTRVVEAVADTAEADPLSIEPLYDVIDPDALDQLLEAAAGVRLEFSYAGHEVDVRSQTDGGVDVTVREACGE